MNSAVRKLSTLALVAAYGSISLLGHGLHWLAPGHGHHRGLEIVCMGHVAEEAHRGCGHHHHGQPQPDGVATSDTDDNSAPRVAASDSCCDAHLCGICAFLLKARGERPQLAAAPVWQQVVAEAPTHSASWQPPTVLGPYSPRGPPPQAA